jgi:hypothetical protein
MEYLTKDVFEVWARNFDRRLDEALALREQVEAHAQEIAVLADRSERAEAVADRAERAARRHKGISGVISAIVSGVVSGLVTWGHK